MMKPVANNLITAFAYKKLFIKKFKIVSSPRQPNTFIHLGCYD